MLVETDETALSSVFQNKATRNEGFKLVLNRYSQSIYYFLRKMGLDHEEADELLQDVFIKFWRVIIQNESGHNLKITLYRLATVSCLDYIVKHQVLSLRGLTSEELLIVVLKDHEEFDFMEIAQITSIPVNDIRNYFKIAINKLTRKDKKLK